MQLTLNVLCCVKAWVAVIIRALYVKIKVFSIFNSNKKCAAPKDVLLKFDKQNLVFLSDDLIDIPKKDKIKLLIFYEHRLALLSKYFSLEVLRQKNTNKSIIKKLLKKIYHLDTNKNTSPNNKTIDLHGFTLEEANKKIEKIINDAYEKDVSKVIVVTGKGIHSNVEKDPYVSKDLSILKFSVPDYIENNSELMKKIIEIKDADKEDGGSGAFYIYLKRKKKS